MLSLTVISLLCIAALILRVSLKHVSLVKCPKSPADNYQWRSISFVACSRAMAYALQGHCAVARDRPRSQNPPCARPSPTVRAYRPIEPQRMFCSGSKRSNTNTPYRRQFFEVTLVREYASRPRARHIRHARSAPPCAAQTTFCESIQSY